MTKSLSSNIIYNILYKCLNIIFPLLTMAYVSRTLLPVGVGKVASAQNIVAYFVIIASLGLPTYGVKKISENSDNKHECSKTFLELSTINFVSTIICIVSYLLLVFGSDFFKGKLSISLIVGIQLFANIFNIDWFYQGLEEYKYIMIRSFIVKFVSLIAIFTFIHTQEDYLLYALIITLSLVSNYIFNVANLHKYVRFHLYKVDIKKHLKPVLILLATTVAIEIYTLADTTMLSLLKGDEVVGYYINSAKIVGVTRTMITAVCAVFLPRLNYLLSHDKREEFNNLSLRGLSILLSISIPAAVGLLFLADNYIYILFGEEFIPSILSLKILTFSVITIAISNFTGYQILVSLGREKIVLYSTIIGAIVNVVLNIFLIIPYGHYGAAIASIITEFIVVIFQLYYVSKLIRLPSKKYVAKQILLPTIIMIPPIMLTKVLISNIILETIVAILVGCIGYVLACLIVKNDFVFLLGKKY